MKADALSHRRLQPGTIVLVPSYIAADHFIRCRIRHRTTRYHPRFGYAYPLQSLDPHPHPFLTRTTAEITLPLPPA